MSIFSYVAFDEDMRAKQLDCKVAFENLEDILEKNFKNKTPELSLAMRRLEEAYMWVGKALRQQQIERDVNSMEKI